MSVTIEAVIVIGIFAVIWGWIIYEMHIAPEVDEYGNVIDRNNEGEDKKEL